MTSRWHQKKEKLRLEQLAREEAAIPDTTYVKDQTSDVAMGKGEDQFYEKKLSKEEKKALAKAKREAKKKAKNKGKEGETEEKMSKIDMAEQALKDAQAGLNAEKDLSVNNVEADRLASEGTICTFATSKKGVDERSRDINITNFTLQHKGMVMLDHAEIVLNHGNRYGLIGRNGCGKSTFMKALGARAVPIPKGIDIFHLKEEIEASDTVTALQAVMSVDEERERLEAQAENLNAALTALTDDDEAGVDDTKGDMTLEEQQELLMDLLNSIYERLDALDASTAETRARSILKGLGFTHEMQEKKTRSFSGGWRMRVSLARALFIQPTLLLLDEPTNHLDMEAVIWLEDYLSKWDKILLVISHSQDFMNTVCTHMIHFTNRKSLVYYDGNYDQFVKTKSEKEENQLKRYEWEQDQIKSMKEYIARFGHGTAKNAKQAQSKEKVLEKMIRAGLTEKPEQEKPLNFKFTDPGHLPPPVLAFHDVCFGYPKCEPLYNDVNFGVDLDSRIALVGPNGAGKTTLIKLMAGELNPTLGDIRPHGHLKIGRFTQHFVDVLDLELTPLQFFEKEYPNDPREEQRKYLGRFGVSGTMQVQKMDELSDGQKSRVVFAKLGREVPHILLLDEPTNHLDMESIDALAKAVNDFEGGMVLVSHDMRLISQVANEIWICDEKKITKYPGDIQSFKMMMRNTIVESNVPLRGDASVLKKDDTGKNKKAPKKVKKLEVSMPTSTPTRKIASMPAPDSTSKALPIPIESSKDLWDDEEEMNKTEPPKGRPVTPPTRREEPMNQSKDQPTTKSYVPPHLRGNDKPPAARYVPPHLRNKK